MIIGIYIDRLMHHFSASALAQICQNTGIRVVHSDVEADYYNQNEVDFWKSFAESCRGLGHTVEVHLFIMFPYGYQDQMFTIIQQYLQELSMYPELMQGWTMYIPEWFGNAYSDNWYNEYFNETSKSAHSAAQSRFYDLVHQYGGKVQGHIGSHISGVTLRADFKLQTSSWPLLDEMDPCTGGNYTQNCVRAGLVQRANEAGPGGALALSQWEEESSVDYHTNSWNATNLDYVINSLPDLDQTGLRIIEFAGTHHLLDSNPTFIRKIQGVSDGINGGNGGNGGNGNGGNGGEQPTGKRAFQVWLWEWMDPIEWNFFTHNIHLFHAVCPCIWNIDANGLLGDRPTLTDEVKASVAYAKQHNVKVYPSLGVSYAELPQTIAAMTSNVHAFADSVVTKVAQLGVDGIDLDIEILGGEHRQIFTEFIQILAARMHAVGQTLVVTVAGKDTPDGTWGASASQDLYAIGNAADFVKPMCYGANVALSIAQVRSWLDYTISKVPKRKIILGFPFYDVSDPEYVGQICDLFIEKDIYAICGWTIDKNSIEQADFDMIAAKLPLFQEPDDEEQSKPMNMWLLLGLIGLMVMEEK